MNIFVTRPHHFALQTWEHEYPRGFSNELRADSPSIYKIVDRADDADIIILMESNLHKRAESIRGFLREPVLQQYCAKVCTINYEDSPAGFLCGLYSSLEAVKFDGSIHRSWPAFCLPNENVYEVDDDLIDNIKPTRLFSFIGSLSHPLRAKLVGKFSKPSPAYTVRVVNKWFNHNVEEKESYVQDLLSSRFVLCPRGHACYTHRIPEAMAIGRVPVVIADGWIPFSIPEKNYYLRVPESGMADLEALLAAKKNDAEALGRNARGVWLKYFSRKNRARAATNAARELLERSSERLTIKAYRRRWRSFQFKYRNQMTLGQRIYRRFKNTIQKQ